jgi:hypothetical protein
VFVLMELSIIHMNGTSVIKSPSVSRIKTKDCPRSYRSPDSLSFEATDMRAVVAIA